MARFAVESWAPAFGVPLDGAMPEADAAAVDASVEVAPGSWAPLAGRGRADCVTFVDGVQQVDAHGWFPGDDGVVRPALFASYAAGTIRCDGRAEVRGAQVRRGVFGSAATLDGPVETRAGRYEALVAPGESPELLQNRLQEAMSALEVQVASAAEPAELLVIDGPLRGRENLPGAVGYIKSHRVRYLADRESAVVSQLAAGERTPLFLVTTAWTRYSWYLRLPCRREHPWSGIVRCEAAGTLSVEEAVGCAQLVAASLPGFASAPHKDGRAPQNLYPIAGLERELRRLLGDSAYRYRALRIAALQESAPVAAAN